MVLRQTRSRSALADLASTLIAPAALALMTTSASAEPESIGGQQEAGAKATFEATSEPPASLAVDDTLADILSHPSFAGFAERILPWAGRQYDQRMRLRDIGSLLPYHSAVNPVTVTAALNRLIGHAERDLQVFYDIYTDQEKLADPDLAWTGLFFYRGQPGAPFAVISPGGGFAYVGSVHEGFPYAAEISVQGFNAFVLTYRTGRGGQTATEDLARAIHYIRGNAEELGVARDGYSVWGSSAGARMAAYIGSHGTAAFGGGEHPAPQPSLWPIPSIPITRMTSLRPS